MGGLTLSSKSFADGSEIPRRYGYKEENKNPPLSISNIPSNTKSLALIMDDPDAMAAVGKLWVHWVIWNINPNTKEIHEGETPSEAFEGITDFGKEGYGGPAPPDKRHTYHFKLYALDTNLELKNGSSKKEVEDAIKGHILDETVLKGTYEP